MMDAADFSGCDSNWPSQRILPICSKCARHSANVAGHPSRQNVHRIARDCHSQHYIVVMFASARRPLLSPVYVAAGAGDMPPLFHRLEGAISGTITANHSSSQDRPAPLQLLVGNVRGGQPPLTRLKAGATLVSAVIQIGDYYERNPKTFFSCDRNRAIAD
jgi:hypothetical protein